MEKKKKILILGAGTWQTPWLSKAKEMGFIVCATDWSPQAAGRHEANYFAPIDLRDKAATLAYAQANHIDAIFTSADIGVPTAAFVAARMGLPCYSEELAEYATNKFLMREKAKALGLGIPEYRLVSELEQALSAAAQIGFPLIIKPVDNFSSKGVCVLQTQYELVQMFSQSKACSFVGKVLIEELMHGTEGSVEALVKDGQIYIMGISEKQKSLLPYRYDVLLEYPGSYSNLQKDRINLFIKQLVTGFGIKNGIIHVEIMVKENSVKLIEFAIRGCGSLVVTHLMPALTSYDVMSYLLWNAFDMQHPIQFTTNYVGVLKFISLAQGKIKSISDKTLVRNIPGILAFDIERQPGEIIHEIKDGRSRPGYVLAYAESKTHLQQIMDDAFSKIKVEFESW